MGILSIIFATYFFQPALLQNEKLANNKVRVFPPPLSFPGVSILEVMHWGGSIRKWKKSGSPSHWMKKPLLPTWIWVKNRFLLCQDTEIPRNICYYSIAYTILIKITMCQLTGIASSECTGMHGPLEMLIKDKSTLQNNSKPFMMQ